MKLELRSLARAAAVLSFALFSLSNVTHAEARFGRATRSAIHITTTTNTTSTTATDPTGACCLPNYEGCAVIDAASCAKKEGSYVGDDSLCEKETCPAPPTGACCAEKLKGCGIVDAETCKKDKGTYVGDDTTCGKDTCPATGACCADYYKGCGITDSVTCGKLHGSYAGDAVPCSPEICEEPTTTTTTSTTLPPITGACCQGGICSLQTSAVCETGIYHGDDSICTPTLCSVCGDGIVETGEECDDGDTASGDGCDSACKVEGCYTCDTTPPTTVGIESTSLPGPSVCVPDNGHVCDDGDQCTINDACLGGNCGGTDVTIRVACDWAIVAGDVSRDVRDRTKRGSDVSGDVCGDRVALGDTSVTGGDAVATESHSLKAITIGPAATIAGDVITGGGGVFGKPYSILLPGLTVSTLPGGVIEPKDATTEYDTTGTSTRVTDCHDAQDAIEVATSLLSGLPSTASFGDLRVRKDAPLTIAPGAPAGVIAGAVNVLDFDELRGGNDAVITLDGGGNANTVYILRVQHLLSLGLRAQILLTNGLVPERVAIVGLGKKCYFGEKNVGGGMVVCPEGKIFLNTGSTWTGSFLSGRGKAQLGETTTLTHVPFFGL